MARFAKLLGALAFAFAGVCRAQTIPQLPAASSVAPSDLYACSQSGVTRQCSIEQLGLLYLGSGRGLIVPPTGAPYLTASPAFGNNSTNIATTGSVAAHEACALMNDYGADPTGTNYSDSAFTAALAASSATFPCVQAGRGVYKFQNALSYTLTATAASVAVKGLGPEVTQFYWPSGQGLTLNAYASTAPNFNNTFSVEGIAFTTGTASNSTVGLHLVNASGYTNQGQSHVRDVKFRGADGPLASYYWGTAFLDTGVWSVNADNFDCTGTPAYLGSCISLQPYGANYVAGFNLSGIGVAYNGVGLQIGPYVQGITLTKSAMLCGSYCIYEPGGQTGNDGFLMNTTNIQSTNGGLRFSSQFSNVRLQGYFITGTGGSNSPIGVELDDPFNAEIAANFQPDSTGSNTGIVINGTPTTPGATLIAGSVFQGMNGSPIDLLSASTLVTVGTNTYNASAAIANSGTGNVFADTTGYTAGTNLTLTGTTFDANYFTSSSATRLQNITWPTNTLINAPTGLGGFYTPPQAIYAQSMDTTVAPANRAAGASAVGKFFWFLDPGNGRNGTGGGTTNGPGNGGVVISGFGGKVNLGTNAALLGEIDFADGNILNTFGDASLYGQSAYTTLGFANAMETHTGIFGADKHTIIQDMDVTLGSVDSSQILGGTVTGLTYSGSTVTVTTSGPHYQAVGDTIGFFGPTVGVMTAFNGSFYVTSVPSSTSFTYTCNSCGTPPSGGALANTFIKGSFLHGGGIYDTLSANGLGLTKTTGSGGAAIIVNESGSGQWTTDFTNLNGTSNLDDGGNWIWTPSPASLTLPQNGNFYLRATSDTRMDLNYRGSDGVQRYFAINMVPTGTLNTAGLWTPFTPVFTSGQAAGSNNVGTFTQIGSTVEASYQAVIGSGGGSGYITMAMPVVPDASLTQACSGRDSATGSAIMGIISGGVVEVYKYDNTAINANSSVFILHCTYKAA